MEIKDNYEENTGHVIVEAFAKRDPCPVPSFCCQSRAVRLGKNCCRKPVLHGGHARALGEISRRNATLASTVQPIQRALLDKHFFRKHGPAASYGQKSKSQKSKK